MILFLLKNISQQNCEDNRLCKKTGIKFKP